MQLDQSWSALVVKVIAIVIINRKGNYIILIIIVKATTIAFKIIQCFDCRITERNFFLFSEIRAEKEDIIRCVEFCISTCIFFSD